MVLVERKEGRKEERKERKRERGNLAASEMTRFEDIQKPSWLGLDRGLGLYVGGRVRVL